MAIKSIPLPTFAQSNRFWKQVKMQPSGCWEWQGYKNRKHYGTFGMNFKQYYAHRLAYRMYYLTDPLELQVCHTCDNPTCVNPFHLFIGTQKDNIADMYEKGRQNKCKGSSHGQAVLTESDVMAARERWQNGETQKALAAEYGVSRQVMGFAVTGRTWKHI